MNRRSLLFALALTALPASPAFAVFGFGGQNEDGGQPGAFLRAAMNARPLAMGGAHTGVADDATSPFWNASGLAQIERFDVVTNYSKLATDASIGAGAFAFPTRRAGAFSINYVTLRSGSFRRRDAANQDQGGFENEASALLLSHGFDLSGRWSAGYTVKAVRQEIDRFSDTGYGADVGLLLRPDPRWQAGFALQNVIQPSLRLRNEAEKLPTEARLGGKFDPVSKLSLAADLSFVRRRSTELNLGVEWRVAGPLALRVGANDREISSGFGLALGDAGLDYAFGIPHASRSRELFGLDHRFSFHLKFGQNVTAATYREFAVRREEKRQEIVNQDVGTDHVMVLRRRMESWDGQMDPETFQQVQAARRSLRELAFTDRMKALEAQAYITHFQGRFEESTRLFNHLHEMRPRNRRIKQHREVAIKRMATHPDRERLASAYEAMDNREQKVRSEQLAARSRALELPPVARSEKKTSQVALAAPPVSRPLTKPAVQTTPPITKAVPPVVEATDPDPTTVKPEVAQAQARFDEGDYVASHMMTRRVLEQDPNDKAAAHQAILSNAIVSAEAILTDPKATVDIAEESRKVDVSMTLYERGQRLRENGRRDEALAILDEAINICPANFLARDLIKAIDAEIEEERWEKLLGKARASR